MTVSDVDLDGVLDIYLVQNFHSPQVETGRMSGGLSQLLRGKGDGSFEVVPVDESGLLVAGDAASLTQADLNG
ncbi:FG-GAP-like repeat-containing protein, partial [Akkermansiaceae bacterium]|nr:FG-GAP-like repeat-containing protein [Akkermansiaceae bacterium]